MLQRSHSLLSRFNPNETVQHFEKRQERDIRDTVTWLKFKLLINKIEIEKEDEIEDVWYEYLDEHPEVIFTCLIVSYSL